MRNRRRLFRSTQRDAHPASQRRWAPGLSLHADNSAAAAAEPSGAAAAPLATLLTQHILRDGERVILVLRPSLWFIPLTCLRFISAVLILTIAVRIFADPMPQRAIATAIEVGLLLIAARLMFAVLQWSGQLYVLTELRILRLAGIFNPEIFDCPLRKIARARLIRAFRERVVGVGSIEIIPCAEESPVGVWHNVPRPREIHRIILSTIARARQGPGELGSFPRQWAG